jgi:hypothetical protein
MRPVCAGWSFCMLCYKFTVVIVQGRQHKNCKFEFSASSVLHNFGAIMLTTEIKDKYRKRLRNGEPDGEIREQMQAAGYTREEIDEVFKPVTRDMGPWFIFCTLITLLAGIILFGKEPAGMSPACFLLSAFSVYKYIRHGYDGTKSKV